MKTLKPGECLKVGEKVLVRRTETGASAQGVVLDSSATALGVVLDGLTAEPIGLVLRFMAFAVDYNTCTVANLLGEAYEIIRQGIANG